MIELEQDPSLRCWQEVDAELGMLIAKLQFMPAPKDLDDRMNVMLSSLDGIRDEVHEILDY